MSLAGISSPQISKEALPNSVEKYLKEGIEDWQKAFEKAGELCKTGIYSSISIVIHFPLYKILVE